MKKFLAVLVMLSLVVGSVFAQASFGGYGRGRLDLVTVKSGATEMRDDALVTDKTIKGPLTNAAIEYSFSAGYTNEEGTAGGSISVTGNQNGFAAPWDGAYIPWRARAWWQPISQVKVNLGWTDWAFGTDDVLGWGYNASAGDVGVAPANGLFGAPSDVFLGGGGYHGLTLGITPMDMFSFNLGLNFMGDDMKARTDLVEVLKTFFVQANVNLNGIGTVSLSYQGGPGTSSKAVTTYDGQTPKYYHTSTTDDYAKRYKDYYTNLYTRSYADYLGMDIADLNEDLLKEIDDWASAATDAEMLNINKVKELGEQIPEPGYGLPIYMGSGDVVSTTSGEEIKTYSGNNGALALRFRLSAIENLDLNFGIKFSIPGKVNQYQTKQHPLFIALGAQYNISDAFGVKTRMKFQFLGKTTDSRKDLYGTEDPFKFGIDITPYFNIAGMNINVNLGLALTKYMYTYADGTPDAMQWNPMQVSWMINPYVVKPVGNVNLYAGIIVQGTPSAYYMTPVFESTPLLDQAKSKSVVEFRIPIGFNVNF